MAESLGTLSDATAQREGEIRGGGSEKDRGTHTKTSFNAQYRQVKPGKLLSGALSTIEAPSTPSG